MTRADRQPTTVRVEHRQVTATVRGLDQRALGVVTRAVPRTGRHRGDRPDELVVTSHRAAAAIAALRRAGYQVIEAGAGAGGAP